MNKLKRTLLINDLSCIGKSSLTAMIPIISSYGIETIPLPTLLLSNHTGFKEYETKDCDILSSFTNIWHKQNINFDLIYTGFFKDGTQILETIDILDKFNSMLLVDPILGDNGKRFSCFDDKYQNTLLKLVSKADIITPNLTEAALLTNSNINDNPINIIKRFDNKYVIITGIKKEDKIGYLIKENNNIYDYYLPYIESETKFHGTGDVFVSSLIGNVLNNNNNNFKDSFKKAANFTNKCILETLKYLPEHWYGLAFEDVLKSF